MSPELPSENDDNALAGLAPERSKRRSEPGDASASPASVASVIPRNRKEGRGGSGERGLVSPDISFDPAVLDGQGDSSNSPCPKTITGGEDWLSVNFHVDFEQFEKLAERLDAAQESAIKDLRGSDEIQVGDVRFIVAARGARQGRGEKSIFMRWRLTAENGLVILLMNRGKAHRTMPNVAARATSLLLMRLGFQRVWDLMKYCIEQLKGTIEQNKLSRVDPCVDLAGTPITAFVEPFSNHWVVSRSRAKANYAVGTFINHYLQGKQATGFTIGKSPMMCRVYDKLVESQRDAVKLAVLMATRWGCLPESASRVEFQIERTKLKQFGIDTVENWIERRGDVLDELTQNWLRLTAGPVDRKHADRTPMHSVWEVTRLAFFAWCGDTSGRELIPLPKLEISSRRQTAMVVGILKGMFARVGKEIRDNDQFFREAEAVILDGI